MGSPRQIAEGKTAARDSNPLYDERYIVGYNEIVAKMSRSELLVNVRSYVLDDDIVKWNRLLGFLTDLRRVEINAADYRDDELNDLRQDIFDYLGENLDYSADGDVWFARNRGLLIRYDGRFVSEYEDSWPEAQELVREKIRDLHPHMEQFVDRAKSLCPSTLRTLRLTKLPQSQ